MHEVDRILAWAHAASASDSEARRARSLGFADFEEGLRKLPARRGAEKFRGEARGDWTALL